MSDALTIETHLADEEIATLARDVIAELYDSAWPKLKSRAVTGVNATAPQWGDDVVAGLIVRLAESRVMLGELLATIDEFASYDAGTFRLEVLAAATKAQGKP